MRIFIIVTLLALVVASVGTAQYVYIRSMYILISMACPR